jgi:class 3 adenylate cyclase
MLEAPTGTVTLVFTDIQGSTALWEHLGEGFKPLLDQHNALFRAAIAEFGGYEVKTEGDAFMVAFQEAGPAVAMCLTMQERLQAADWPDALNDDAVAEFAGTPEDGLFRGLRVRMGVHTGTPDCQPDPVTGRMDYFGRMVNRAARVGGVGHGGQLVVSQSTWEALGADGPRGSAAVENLGEHALKGLERREHLRQLLPASLAERTFPRLKTPNLKKTNLPTRLDSFFGREPEIAELGQRIADGQRLITVVGQPHLTGLGAFFGANRAARHRSFSGVHRDVARRVLPGRWPKTAAVSSTIFPPCWTGSKTCARSWTEHRPVGTWTAEEARRAEGRR